MNMMSAHQQNILRFYNQGNINPLQVINKTQMAIYDRTIAAQQQKRLQQDITEDILSQLQINISSQNSSYLKKAKKNIIKLL